MVERNGVAYADAWAYAILSIEGRGDCMSELVTDCPRCRASQITFDVKNSVLAHERYGWQKVYEAFSICRNCKKCTIFVLSDIGKDEAEFLNKNKVESISGGISGLVYVEGFISLKDNVGREPPEHLPTEIEAVFKEGATCQPVRCFNAAGTMYRLCVDLATRSLLPNEDGKEPNRTVRRSLGLRLQWMLDNHILPSSLRELSTCIKEEGNDGAHAGTLTSEEAEDLYEFTMLLLERLYTEPERLRLAEERRRARRGHE